MDEAGGTRSSPTGEAAGRRAPRVEEEPTTFDAMFTRYQRPIYGYLLGMVGNAAQAQDLTQDTFLTAYKALPRTPDPALPAWLYRIATRTALGALRRRRRLRWLPFALCVGGEDRWLDPAADPLARCAAQQAVRLALARLSPRQRACLLLRAREGLAIAEIAYVLDLSSGAVKVTLRRAKELMADG